jgi:outer membrane scaffolding protein for murein synthesis (MipA/OmpV family)
MPFLNSGVVSYEWAGRLALAATILVCLASSAHAQASPASQPETSSSVTLPEKGPWDITLGGGVGVKPDYEGAKVYKATPLPFISVRYDDLLFFSGEGLGVNVIYLDHFRAGLTAGYAAGRAQNDDTHLNGLGHIDDSLTGGAFVAYALGSYEFTAKAQQALSETQNGLQATFGATYGLRVGKLLHFRFGPSVTIADRDYMQTWFGITPTQALNSSAHLPIYTPGAGVKDAGFRLSSSYDLSEHWKLRGIASLDELVGDAASSPIVQNKTQGLLGLGVAYHF